MYLTLRRATCHVSTVAAGQCRRTLQAADKIRETGRNGGKQDKGTKQ